MFKKPLQFFFSVLTDERTKQFIPQSFDSRIIVHYIFVVTGTQGREGKRGQIGPRGLLGPKGNDSKNCDTHPNGGTSFTDDSKNKCHKNYCGLLANSFREVSSTCNDKE